MDVHASINLVAYVTKIIHPNNKFDDLNISQAAEIQIYNFLPITTLYSIVWTILRQFMV